MMTTFIFRVRNVPAALYKAMGGFATNGVNMTKLESYQLGGSSPRRCSTPTSRAIPTIRQRQERAGGAALLLKEVRILGVYPRSPSREEWICTNMVMPMMIGQTPSISACGGTVSRGSGRTG
jgi:prephenate dehydratase